MDYLSFIEDKSQLDGNHGFAPTFMPDCLFPFQSHLAEWSILKGRAAQFADCGLGKTLLELVWSWNVYKNTGKPVLITTPLAVTFQMEREAQKFGIDAAVSRNGKITAPITITNYDQLHRFKSSEFGGSACDESSAIKHFDGTRRLEVTEFMRKMKYRLLATATAAPNDYPELGTSSEALGYLGYMDMLSRFFTNKLKTSAAYHGKYRVQDRDVWRFKGHAEQSYWKWVASWARAIRKPSDLGFSDDGFVLPPLCYDDHIVTARTVRQDRLFDIEAVGLDEEREEQRRTITERCEKAAELMLKHPRSVGWVQLNPEGDLLTKLVTGAIQVSGSDTPEEKEEKLLAFSTGEATHLVTKPKIGAWGLNWQHCAHTTYFPSHSYEQHYQSVRRFWRFGQVNPVQVDTITTEGGKSTLANLRRKSAQADRMFEALVAHMSEAMTINQEKTYDKQVEVPSWAI